MNLLDWVLSPNLEEFNDDWLNEVRDLEESNQIAFLRKFIKMHQLQMYKISTKKLECIIKIPKLIHFGVYFVIRNLCLYKKENRFLYNNEIYDIIKSIYSVKDKENGLRLQQKVCECDLFDLCHNITPHCSIVNPNNKYKEDDNYCLLIANIFNDYSCNIIFGKKCGTSFRELAREIRENIPSSTYDNVKKIWEIPNTSWQYLRDFIIKKSTEKHTIRLKYMNENSIKDLAFSNPFNVVFCEGKYTSSQENFLKVDGFHWCNGRPYFNCPDIHEHTDYRKYTFYDFINILSLPIDKDKLKKFYGKLNWFFNDYFEHLFCDKCHSMLEPTNQNHYNAHRMTYFTCTNSNCIEHGVQIYLNHCFQEKCNNVIDSRVSKKCSNGFVICNKCGVCCGSQQFAKKEIVNIISEKIQSFFNDKKFHLDNHHFFCPKCGTQLIQNTKIGFLYCPNDPDYYGWFPLNEPQNIKRKKDYEKIRISLQKND